MNYKLNIQVKKEDIFIYKERDKNDDIYKSDVTNEHKHKKNNKSF